MAEAERGLADYDPRWERGTRGGRGDVFADAEVLLASDFEGANGCNFRALAPDHYAVDLEPEPGTHRFGGLGYYVCVGVRNELTHGRRVRLRLNAPFEGTWGEQSASFQVRHAGVWSEVPAGDIHRVPDLPDSLDLDLALPPGGREQDGTIFLSNYHWWPYTEMLDWLQTVESGTVRQIGTSFQGRAVYAVEFGDPGNPTMVHTQTPQPSEMGSLACRALIDFLGSGGAAANAGPTLEGEAKAYAGETDGRIADADLRHSVVTHNMNDRAFRLTQRRAVEEARGGGTPGPATSIFKMYGTELEQEKSSLFVSMRGTDGLGWSGAGFDPQSLEDTRTWLSTRAASIYSGSNEIQRNIVAKRVLGLPD